MLTQARLKELLSYSPETGLFTWIKRQGRSRPGIVAGSTHSKGYKCISVDKNRYYAHRLAFLFIEGVMPKNHIDHIDRNKANNKWVNIRHATNAENHQNSPMQKNNKSGFTGVSWHKSAGKWEVSILVDGKKRHLGLFVCVQEAGAVAKAARDEAGYSATHGERN